MQLLLPSKQWLWKPIWGGNVYLQYGHCIQASTRFSQIFTLIMAAPPAANLTILAEQNVANAAGLFFDVATANAAPQLPGGPPAPAALVPYVRPPAVPGPAPLPPLYCHDRGHHFPWGPGPVVAPANPCASAMNPAVPFENFPRPYGLWRRPCERDDIHGNGAYHRICRSCIGNTQNQPWWQAMFNNMTVSLGPLPGNAANRALAAQQPLGAWTRFQTHLCRKCEIQEQAILSVRLQAQAAAGGVRPYGTAEMEGNARDYPYVTCTCCFSLVSGSGNIDLCIRHRHVAASNEHNRLLIIRAVNDHWLRTTGRDQNNPHRLIDLNVPNQRLRIEKRERERTYRACRCGADLKSLRAQPPQVLMCLGCEGVVHIAGHVTVIPGFTGVGPPPGVIFPNAKIRAAGKSHRLRR